MLGDGFGILLTASTGALSWGTRCSQLGLGAFPTPQDRMPQDRGNPHFPRYRPKLRFDTHTVRPD